MGKVYLVTEGWYSDYHICGVFSSEEKAKEAMALLSDGEMEEFELDPVSPHPPGMTFWFVEMQRDGAACEARRISVSLADKTAEESAPLSGGKSWRFTMWARDREHAVKIANERRIQMLASGEWAMTWEEWVRKRS